MIERCMCVDMWWMKWEARIRCSMYGLSLLLIFGMASHLVFAWTFMCPYNNFFYIHGPSCALIIFFSMHNCCLYWEKIWGRLYRMWSIKGNKWIVWKCYPSSVEVLANGGSVYVVLDHESRKRNSQRSQNFAKLKMIQAACIWIVSL